LPSFPYHHNIYQPRST